MAKRLDYYGCKLCPWQQDDVEISHTELLPLLNQHRLEAHPEDVSVTLSQPRKRNRPPTPRRNAELLQAIKQRETEAGRQYQLKIPKRLKPTRSRRAPASRCVLPARVLNCPVICC